MPFDVCDRDSAAAALKTLPEEWKSIDVLINNAGLAIGVDKEHEGNPDEWDVMIDTNIKALLSMTRLVVPGMVERGRGHIINIGSIAGDAAYPGAYAVILLRPQGYPCVFYGDYYGLDAREGRNIQPVIDIMLKLRHECLYGIQRDYFDDSSIVGWTMEGDGEHKNSGLVVIMTDKTGGTKTMNVGAVLCAFLDKRSLHDLALARCEICA